MSNNKIVDITYVISHDGKVIPGITYENGTELKTFFLSGTSDILYYGLHNDGCMIHFPDFPEDRFCIIRGDRNRSNYLFTTDRWKSCVYCADVFVHNTIDNNLYSFDADCYCRRANAIYYGEKVLGLTEDAQDVIKPRFPGPDTYSFYSVFDVILAGSSTSILRTGTYEQALYRRFLSCKSVSMGRMIHAIGIRGLINYHISERIGRTFNYKNDLWNFSNEHLLKIGVYPEVAYTISSDVSQNKELYTFIFEALRECLELRDIQ